MTRDEALEAVFNPKGPPTDPQSRAAFDGWLERDEDLRTLYEEQSALFSALDEWAAPEPSAEFDAAMAQRIEAERDREPVWLSWINAALAPRWASAAALGAVLAAAWVWGPASSEGPAPAPKTAVALTPADAEYLDEWDRALEDLDMLEEFDAFGSDALEGRS